MCEAIKRIRKDAKAEGRAEERLRFEEKLLKIEENLRKSGMPEEQIKQILSN